MKAIIALITLFFLYGCGNSGESSTVVTTDEITLNNNYIDSIPDDTQTNPDKASVFHHKASIPMLVILLSYSDKQITSSASTWAQKIFGYSEGELNHYYDEASAGHFHFEPATESYGTANDGIISVKLSKYHPNADIDSATFESALHPDLKSALESANNYIDFSNYDNDANGAITPDELLLTFIMAGYEDSYEGYHIAYGVWAHQYCTSTLYAPTLDGVSLIACSNDGNYAIFGERHDISRRLTHDATIGVIAHELGHSTFKLPDLYNTSGSTGGIGYFGLMGAGTWAQKDDDSYAGATPTHFCAWSKSYIGWITPQERSGSTTLNETSSSDFDIIKIPISANNYYLLENRNNSGYDRGLASLEGTFKGGMAIWHVDENKLTTANFENNIVNNDINDMGVELIEAKTTNLLNGLGGGAEALFYSPNVNTFGTKITNVSAPSSVMNLTIN